MDTWLKRKFNPALPVVKADYSSLIPAETLNKLSTKKNIRIVRYLKSFCVNNYVLSCVEPNITNLEQLKEHLIIPSNGNIIPELIKPSSISKSIEYMVATPTAIPSPDPGNPPSLAPPEPLLIRLLIPIILLSMTGSKNKMNV